MQTVPLSTIFDISYGSKLDLNKLREDDNGINFVSRTSANLGIITKVRQIDGLEPLPAGTITVTLGGSYLLSSFIQPKPYYTAQNIKVLTPKSEMDFKTKLFYTICISKNRFRYSSHGREANRSLGDLVVPDLDSIPDWVKTISTKNYTIPNTSISSRDFNIDTKDWKWFRYNEMFTPKKGKRLTKKNIIEGKLPFIAAIKGNNGVRQYIENSPLHEGNTITVNYNGSVGEAFYQPEPFWASDDVIVLYPKFKMNQFIGLFLVTLIRKEIYRFNYGRKWNLDRMKTSILKLPIQPNGTPDWEFIEDYMKSLPFSNYLSEHFGQTYVPEQRIIADYITETSD